MEISQNLLDKYHIADLQTYINLSGGNESEGLKTLYQTFLIQTDYIPNKIIEAQVLGETLDEDYTEVLQARKYARQQISNLNLA